MAYRYLFGPVNSRRLGRSLGVDLVPAKVCSLDCVYCESGRTTRLTTVRGEYVPTAAVMAELDDCLAAAPVLDYITFSGAGEPTLHSGLGTIIGHLKKNYPQYEIALITNGTLLGEPALRREVSACDLIVPSLDAASDAVMAMVNRPCRGLTAGSLITALAALRAEYRGRLWLEIFIVPGVNDSAAELAALAAAARRIGPDRVQLNTLDRPAPGPGVRAATAAGLATIAGQFPPPVDIVARVRAAAPADNMTEDLAAALIALVRRRPATAEDIAAGLGADRGQVDRLLVRLTSERRLNAERQSGLTFYRPT